MRSVLANASQELAPLISDTVGVAIVSGVVTVATACATLALTNRHARKQTQELARETRRNEARQCLTDFVTAGIAWAKAQDFLVPIFYKEATNHAFWIEWVDTDTGVKLRVDSEVVTRAGAQLRLLVQDEELIRAINDASNSVMMSDAMVRVIEQGRKTGGDLAQSDGAVRDAFAYYRDVVSAFEAVERLAARYVAGALA